MKRRRSLTIAIVVATVIAGEGELAARAVAAHRLQGQRASAYAQTRATLERLQKSVAHVDAVLASTRRDVDHRAREVADARAELLNAQKLLSVLSGQLHDADEASLREQATLAAAKFCSSAEVFARVMRKGGDAGGVVAALQKAASPCASAVAVDDPDPAVFPFDFPDPSITRVDKTYYAYATNGPLGNVQLATSTDLAHWNAVGDALPVLPVWANPGNVWAPSVVALAGKYVMYYSPRSKTGNQCLSVAVAASPLGPFVDSSIAPFECTSGYALDPKAFLDAHGQPWLVWKNGVGNAIWSQPLRPDGLGLVGSPTKLIAANQAWEERNVEGPTFVESGGVLRLFYSASDWNSSRYGVGEAICASPTGPCRKPHDGPVLTTHDQTTAPGGADFFTTDTGQLWTAFHAYKGGGVGFPSSRLMHVARVRLDGDQVRFGAP